MNNKSFYVYEWFNVDSGEVFYVGKGTKGRWKDKKSRNQYFKNYYNKHNCDVRKVKQNLTEEEAFSLEVEMIEEYKNKGECKCNLTIGGEGATFEEYSEEWYRSKMRMLLTPVKRLEKYSSLLLESFFQCGIVDKDLEDMSLSELSDVWDRYVELREEDRIRLESQATIDEMWENDPIFRDIWEGIC